MVYTSMRSHDRIAEHDEMNPTLRPLPLLLLFLFATACTGFRQVAIDVYRSPQPGEDDLARTIDALGIRTVVCLRGGEGAAASARATDAADAAFRHIPMSAKRQPSPATLLALWDVAANAERPLLLHCRAGVDRTGLASALVVLHDTGDLARARRELELIPHGYFGMLGTEAMIEVLDRYAPHAGELSFPRWVEQVYTGLFAPVESGPAAR